MLGSNPESPDSAVFTLNHSSLRLITFHQGWGPGCHATSGKLVLFPYHLPFWSFLQTVFELFLEVTLDFSCGLLFPFSSSLLHRGILVLFLVSKSRWDGRWCVWEVGMGTGVMKNGWLRQDGGGVT